MLVLFLPAGILLLLFAYRLAFGALWDRGLSAFAAFGGERVRAGSQAVLGLTIRNEKQLPLPVLVLEFKTRRGLDFLENENVTVTDRCNVIEYFSVGRMEELQRTCELCCISRGVYRIEELAITVPESFGSVARIKKLPSEASLTVLPRMLPAGAVDGVNELILGEVMAKKRLFEDVFTFRGIREYTEADPLSRVNWKASARTGELLVNERDFTFGQETCFLLNLEPPGIRYEGSLLEAAISLAFDAADGCLACRIPVSLMTNGRDYASGEELRIDSGSSQGHLTFIGDLLARIDLEKPVRPFHELLAGLGRGGGEAVVTYVLISSAMGDKLLREAEAFAGRAGGLIWLCPKGRGEEVKEPPASVLFKRIEIEGSEDGK